ncbi:MAG: hypothetical protein IPF79_06195 [Ignavibacteria bacterium]|nr:hypothetical protein [Ignavibacteria bacterium]
MTPDKLVHRVAIAVKREAEEVTIRSILRSQRTRISLPGRQPSQAMVTSVRSVRIPSEVDTWIQLVLLSIAQPSGQFSMEVVNRTADSRTLSDVENFTLVHYTERKVSQPDSA